MLAQEGAVVLATEDAAAEPEVGPGRSRPAPPGPDRCVSDGVRLRLLPPQSPYRVAWPRNRRSAATRRSPAYRLTRSHQQSAGTTRNVDSLQRPCRVAAVGQGSVMFGRPGLELRDLRLGNAFPGGLPEQCGVRGEPGATPGPCASCASVARTRWGVRITRLTRTLPCDRLLHQGKGSAQDLVFGCACLPRQVAEHRTRLEGLRPVSPRPVGRSVSGLEALVPRAARG